MKHVLIILAVLFVFFVMIGVYQYFLNWALVVLTGVVSLLCWLLFYLQSVREERDLLKEGNQYFIDTFQHIRNPISLIKTPLDVVHEGECPESVRREVAIALHNIERLEQHLATLIGLKHSFMHSACFDVAEHEIGSFLKKKVNPLQSYAADLDMTLEVVPEFEYASAWFDQGKVSPVIDRFVTSAIECASPETHLVMQVLLNDEYWAIKIKDSGNGLFLKYCKWYLSWLPTPKTTHLKKWKMGGAFFKKMLNLCDGKISVSEGDVLLRFPLKCPFGRIRSYPKMQKEYKQEDTKLNPNTSLSKKEKPLVLLADEDESFRNYLENSLLDNFNVKTFSDGLEALESIHDERPDLIICDIKLQRIGGDELSLKLKSFGETSYIPIILLGSLLDRERRLKRNHSLADVFMYKPFNISDLKIEMSVLIRNSRFKRKSFLQKMFGEEFLVEKKEEKRDTDLKFLEEVKAYVLDNLEKDDFIVDDIASKMCMSRTTFYNRWKSLTGEAPKYLISRIRMEKARELLESGKYSVTIVAEMVGMKNIKNFRNKYKEYFGKSPRESLKKV